jgi:hypothetical protein
MEADWGSDEERERGDGESSTRSIQDLASALYFSQTDTSKRDTVAELERSTRMGDGEEVFSVLIK